MAAAGQVQNEPELRPFDTKCEYTAFDTRVGGKVPCLGLGPTTPEEIEATPQGTFSSICFQKVNTGIVKAALPVADFLPVKWADAPSEPPPDDPPAGQNHALLRNRNEEYPLVPARNVENTWLEFTNAVSRVKEGMLKRMTQQGKPQPQTLLRGFQDKFWNGARHNSLDHAQDFAMLDHIERDTGGPLNLNVKIEHWILSLLKGFSQNAAEKCRDLLIYLLPRCQSSNHKITSPMASSGSLEDGSVSCLVYGYNDEQWANARGRTRNRRVRQRFLMPRRRANYTSRSRSRSCSSSSSDDDGDLENNVEDQRDPEREDIDDTELLNEPDEYILKPKKLHKYFESHKPDVLVGKYHLVQDKGNPGYQQREFTAKIIVEISSAKKYKTPRLSKHVTKNVERCVQSCLAAFAVNQALMYGVVVLVDGLVLIKVERVRNQRRYQYNVSETNLITWDNPQGMHSILDELNNILL